MIAFTHIPSIPGVYAIVHQPSGQRYIGSSEDMRRRVAQHTGSLRYGTHPNPVLQKAWTEEGEHTFVIELLSVEEGETIKDAETRHIQLYRTQSGNTGFNLTRNGKNGGYRPGSGRKRKPVEQRTARHDGKYAFWISGEHALKLQTLMLRDVPGVGTPDQMIEHLIDKEAN